MKVTRPLISYMGSKYRIGPWVIQHLPPHKIYVEPFGGGGSVLLQKPRAPFEVYNDLDEEIVNVFRVIRHFQQAKQLRRLLNLTPYSPSELGCLYEPTSDPIERARRVICRSYFLKSPNSMIQKDKTFCRTANSNNGNQWRNYIRAFKAFHGRLAGVTVECLDALKLIGIYDTPETLFYVDPPYVASTRSGKKYRHELTDDQHRELASILRSVKGMVVLSGYPSDLYEELYGDWKMLTRSNTNTANLQCTEGLWLSPKAQASLADVQP